MARPMIPAFAAPVRRHTDETATTCVVETDVFAIPDGSVGIAGMPIPAEIGAERFEPVTAQLLEALGWSHGSGAENRRQSNQFRRQPQWP